MFQQRTVVIGTLPFVGLIAYMLSRETLFHAGVILVSCIAACSLIAYIGFSTVLWQQIKSPMEVEASTSDKDEVKIGFVCTNGLFVECYIRYRRATCFWQLRRTFYRARIVLRC